MSWNRKGRHAYFYRSIRLGDRVVKEYLGRGEEAEEAARVYRQTIDRLRTIQVPLSLALKPSQFGVDLNPGRALDLLAARQISLPPKALSHQIREGLSGCRPNAMMLL